MRQRSTFARLVCALAMQGVAMAVSGSETNPFANTRSEGFIDAVNRKWIDCVPATKSAKERSSVVSRRYARVTFDACEWQAAVDRHDLKQPATIYRSGVDVTCVLEEWDISEPAAIDRNDYVLRLSTRGMKSATVDKDADETIAGEVFRRQVISGTSASRSFEAAKPRQRVLVWQWSKERRRVALACAGPVAAVDGDDAAIRELAHSLRIGADAAPAR